jgi:prevent-host-death family protein
MVTPARNVRTAMRWQVNEAKSRLTELIQVAQKEGPQVITRHGVDTAVVLSIEDFHKLEAAKPDFRDYLLSGPKLDAFDIDRPRDFGREIEL